MLKSNKLSKFNKIVVSILLILATCFSIVFVATQVNKSSNNENLSLSAVSDVSGSSINTLSFIEPYDIIDNMGKGGSGTFDDPYYETPWYGRIKCLQRHFTTNGDARTYVLEANVDVRDIAGIRDDVIVEFKFYSQTPNLGIKKAEKVGYFKVKTNFTSSTGDTKESVKDCMDKSSSGWTIAGTTKTSSVWVEIYYSFYDGKQTVNQHLYFSFYGTTE